MLALAGCAHLGGRQPAWYCFAMVEENAVRAMGHRLLDGRGSQIEAREEWIRGFQLSPRDFYEVEWVHRDSAATPVDGTVTMRLAPAIRPPLPAYRLELRSVTANGPLVARGPLASSETAMPEVRLGWSRMGQWLHGGSPLWLVLVDKSGAVRDSEAVPAALFERGLVLVRRVAAETAAKAATFEHSCEPHQEIIPT